MTQETKNEVRYLVNGWDLYDDIFMLAEAYLKMKQFLINNEFPMEEYKEWLKKQK